MQIWCHEISLQHWITTQADCVRHAGSDHGVGALQSVRGVPDHDGLDGVLRLPPGKTDSVKFVVLWRRVIFTLHFCIYEQSSDIHSEWNKASINHPFHVLQKRVLSQIELVREGCVNIAASSSLHWCKLMKPSKSSKCPCGTQLWECTECERRTFHPLRATDTAIRIRRPF